jgi:uncharacterized protein
MKTYTYYVSGTHCASCKILIEDILTEQDFVNNARVNLKEEIVEIDTDTDISGEEIVVLLSKKIQPHGYALRIDRVEDENKKDTVIWKAIPIGLLFLVLFFVLQKSGILNIGIGDTTPVTSLLIGLIASLSSCLAIVGGLVLSLSAKISEDTVSDTRTFFLFHTGRLVSFALLGGVLGLLGNAIGINFTFTAVLGIIASVVMIFLGLHLTGIIAKNRLTLHSGIFKFFRKVEHQTFAPIMVGLGTFFLPCGFTQSMQIAALSSGSFMSGLLIMLAFAIGTLPVLLLLSFGSASFAHGKHAPLFFKSAGVVVIGLGIFALLAGLAGVGIINPLFSI